MFSYKLYLADGEEIGEASYIQMVQPGEEILYRDGRRFRVLDLEEFEEEGAVAVRGDAQSRACRSA